jgi:hypothetical protein
VAYKLSDNNLAKVSRVADDLHFSRGDCTAIQMSVLFSPTQYGERQFKRGSGDFTHLFNGLKARIACIDRVES